MNVYAMDLRQYDPAIARWTVMDPVIHHSMSPYNAFDNNPVYWADPSGGNSISSALSNLFSWENRFHYNWDSGTYSMFGKEFSSNAVASLLETSRNTDLTISLDPENSTGNGGGNPQGVHGVGTAFFKAGMIMSPTFFGTPIRLYPGNSGTASYFGEAINISVGAWKTYLEKGLDSGIGRLLMHEYGHYLQSQTGGKAWYYLITAPASLISFLSSNSATEHAQNWAEIQASTLAYYYFGKPEKFTDPRIGANIVKDNYSSMQILNSLYNQYLNHPNY